MLSESRRKSLIKPRICDFMHTLNQIDKRMRLDFPHKFGNTESTVTTKPTQTVASAKRSVNSRSQKTVRLTPSQVTIAKKLGVPLELYAKQLNITKER